MKKASEDAGSITPASSDSPIKTKTSVILPSTTWEGHEGKRVAFV